MPRQTAPIKLQHRTASRLAWALWAIYLLVLTGAIIFAYLARSYPPDSADLLPPFSRVLLYLPALFAFPTIGALIAASAAQPDRLAVSGARARR